MVSNNWLAFKIIKTIDLDNLFFLEAKPIISNEGQSRFPLKCYCYASKPTLQNSITAAIGANFEASVLRSR